MLDGYFAALGADDLVLRTDPPLPGFNR
jgi:hypothetical protein